MMAAIKAILFDVDDTLVHYGKQGMQWHIDTAKALGLRIPSQRDFAFVWGMTWDAFISKLWPSVDVSEFQSKYYEVSDINKKVKLVDGINSAIVKLKEMGYFVGILTSRDSKTLRLRAAELDFELFDRIITADDVTAHKPDPGVFSKILSELAEMGISKEEVLYLGDAPLDFKAADGAGVQFIGVLTGCFSAEDFKAIGCERTIRSASDLPKSLNPKP